MQTKIKENIQALQQGASLLNQLSDSAYVHAEQSAFKSSIGEHIRHNLDHYDCFLKGLKSGRIDYSQRQRESRLEQDRAYAIAEISRLLERLESLATEQDRPCVMVAEDVDRDQSHTTIKRELDFLASHTVHHYAIVAILCRLQGISVHEDFGLAPSTLRHRAACAH